MSPTLEPGNIVLIALTSLKKGSIVLAEINGREVIKRVDRVENDMVYLIGDNRHDSTDSRHYGLVNKNVILGTVMIIFPKATNPPKLVKSYGLWLGRASAGVLVVMALVHLFRIDTLVPILDEILPGGSVLAGLATVAIIFSEIFAVPFALRMKLSLFAQLLSGALVALAPLWWLLLSIWTYDTGQQVGQFGEFVPVYATTLLLLVNLLWVAFNYYTLYTLGYNRLKLKQLIKI